MSAETSNRDREKSLVSLADTLENLNQPANRMILMGSPEWVRGTIHQLHCLGIAEVGAWSKLIPLRRSREVVSILKQSKASQK